MKKKKQKGVNVATDVFNSMVLKIRNGFGTPGSYVHSVSALCAGVELFGSIDAGGHQYGMIDDGHWLWPW